jgi:sulfonate transport system ATP-binding protein
MSALSILGSSSRTHPAPLVAADVAVHVTNVSKVYGRGAARVPALDGIDLEVWSGEFVCIVGASGCGKSTLLSVVAGLEPPSAGGVRVSGGRPALMFQEPALLPWLDVAANVALPIKLQRVPRSRRDARVAELLALVHLEGFARRRPHELSGGMRQRVALARALAQRSRVLLMDEPFAAVDAITRDLLHDDLARIHAETGTTVLFVTHNVREAVRLADRILMLSSRPGRVIAEWQVDMPRPRRLESTDVAAVAADVTARLREEIGRHGRR